MVYTTLMTVNRKKQVFVPLCFMAQEDNSTVQLNKIETPFVVNLEISTNGITWTDYTIGDTITLANVGDKIYMRNKSETDTEFSEHAADYYQFAMTGKIGASGDITSLLNKNGTSNSLSSYCFYSLFRGCTSLTTAPKLPSTKLHLSCYRKMFSNCTNLTTLPELPAIRLINTCYVDMFNGCTNIKLSETQTGEYKIPYRIPTTGTGIEDISLGRMFDNTGGTFTGTPTINTTYYLSNTVI